MAILISDKTDFKSKLSQEIRRILYKYKRTIHQEDITIINIYEPNSEHASI